MIDPLLLLAAAAGTGAGAVLRYLAGRIDHPQSFPWPTILVNALGSILLGALLALEARGALGANALYVLGGGLAGGLTTFSSLAVDAIVLFKDGRRSDAAAYLAATLVVGIAGAGAGWWLGS